jgi:hypothetical protein
MHVSASLAGWATGEEFYLGFYATAEAAARARDRAVVALQRVGLNVSLGLNFPEADYQGEELLQLSGTAVVGWLLLQWVVDLMSLMIWLNCQHDDDLLFQRVCRFATCLLVYCAATLPHANQGCN